MTGPDSQAVLVTGMAWKTPLGDGVEEVWRQLLAGASGVRSLPSSVRLRNDRVAWVPDVCPDLAPTERQVTITTSTLAAAFTDAGLSPYDASAQIVLGSSFAGDLDDPTASSLHGWASRAIEQAGVRTAPLTVSTACSASADAVLVGGELIRAGAADVCVCGGVDVVTTAKRLGHSALGTMTSNTLRAFDDRHDGMVLGEGAALLVLESAASAQARSARVRAVLRGAGSSNDAAGLTTPDASGKSIVLAIRRALHGSGLDRRQIAVISAHGTGTPVNDAVEAASLSAVFAGLDPVVFATKGALGHSLGVTGAIEAMTTILALRDGVVPPVQGLESVVREMSLPLPVGRAQRLRAGAGVSLTLGFGGFNTCLVFERGGRW